VAAASEVDTVAAREAAIRTTEVKTSEQVLETKIL
jgi:hypothetical protein